MQPLQFRILPIALSAIGSRRLSVVAYLAYGPATAPEIAEATGANRFTTVKTLTALEVEGVVEHTTRRRVGWQLTDAGRSELASLHNELSLVIKGSQ